MKAVFFGTPSIAVPALRALAQLAEVVGVVCQPDRPAGRGLALQTPAVKQAALELGLDVYQPLKVRTGELTGWLLERQPDFALVLAYGRILPADVLNAPRRGCLNLHASLLPKYRGAAPIQWAIFNGERETGFSLMQMDEGLDTGPVFSTATLAIAPEETSGELTSRMADLAAEVVKNDLLRAVRGELSAVPQNAALATHAPPLTREHGLIDFSRSAQSVHDKVRALAPKPGAYCRVRGKTLTLRATRVVTGPSLRPGQVRVERPRILIGTADGALELLRGQLEGKKELSALELVNGRAINDDDELS